MIDTDTILAGLNEAQREAVLETEGPLLILAGAGSGKTRVITSRVAYLIGRGFALPHQIVAVTFTNKAAGEMKERLVRLLGQDAAGARLGTFHALCLRILRRDGERIGIPPGFQIYDTADQLALVRAGMKDLGIEEAEMSPRMVLSRISHAKNRLITSEQFTKSAVFPAAKTIALCYETYQASLKKNGAVDFDDLIGETLRLFDTHTDVGERHARWCRYLLVDEYQDTNHVQYRLIRALAAAHRNICCVGDSDQSIYKFRGADINNILAFESDYPDARIVKLERNYRSTKAILRAASGVIENNERRHPKRLWSDGEEGLPVHYHRARDDRDEAEAVARIVASLNGTLPSGEIAVLYRTNNQSRLIEEALVRSGIRYRIIGSLRFYERKEIKDLLAYLRLLLAPEDDLAFLRAVNTPPRGIGRTTIDQIASEAAKAGCSLLAASRAAVASNLLAARAASAVRGFLETIDGVASWAGEPNAPAPGSPTRAADRDGIDPENTGLFFFEAHRERIHPADADRASLATGRDGTDPTDSDLTPLAADSDGAGPTDSDLTPLAADKDSPDPIDTGLAHLSEPHAPIVPMIGALIAAIDFRAHLAKAHPGDYEDREENLEALVSAAAEYDEQEPGGGLQGFLDRSSLRGDTDDVQGDAGVTLLTIHSAKGLEFTAVVLAGLEEGLFPHIRSSDSSEDLEEERRLCYVAITRAKKRLILTNAVLRRSFGDFVENPPSRFLDEIPADLLVYSESSPWSGVEGDPLQRAGRPGERQSAPSGFMSGASDGTGGAGGASRAVGMGGAFRGGGGRGAAGDGGQGRFDSRRSQAGGSPSRGRGSVRPAFSGGGGAGSARSGSTWRQGVGIDAHDDYAVGRIVTHPMFGRGTILHKEGAGDGLKLTIRFQESGTRKILPRHTTLVVHD